MPAPVGILAGVPETPGDIAERGMVRTQQMDLAEQANVRAEGTAGMEREKFQLEKQFVPYRLQQAKQEIEANDLKFSEAIQASKNKQEGMRLGNEMSEKMKAGTLTEQEMLTYGINISRYMGDERGMWGAINAYSHVLKETEQGKAHGKLFTDLGVGTPGGGLFGKAFAPDATVEDLSAVLKGMTENPLTLTLESGKKLMAQTLERMGKVAPSAYVDAIKLFYARLATAPTANAAQLWNQILSENPDAAPYGKDHEPAEVKAGIEVQKKVAETKAIEEAKLPSALATEARKATSAIELERVKGEETRKTQAEKDAAALERVQERVNKPATFREASVQHSELVKERNSLVQQLNDPNLLSFMPETVAAKRAIQDQLADLDIALARSRKDMAAAAKKDAGEKGAPETAPEATGIDLARMRGARIELDKGVKAKGTMEQARVFLAKKLAAGEISKDEEQRLLSEYTPKFTPKK